MVRFVLNTLLGFVLASSPWASAQAQPLAVSARITSVTVYPDSALVTRSADVDLEAGMHQILFENIVPAFDENTLTVSGKGSGEFRIHGAVVQWDYVAQDPNERVKDLQQKIEALNDQITAEEGKQRSLLMQKDFLKSIQLHANQQIPQDLVTKTPNAVELEGLFNFIGNQGDNLEGKGQAILMRVRELRREKEALERKLADLNQDGHRAKHHVVVDVECVKRGSLTLNISFLAANASWRPVYDARTNISKGEVGLSSFALVSQNTGEDWRNVDMTISTAKPSLGGHLPYVAPWILRPAPVYPASRQLMKAAKMDDGLQYAAMDAVTATEPRRNTDKEEASLAVGEAGFRGISVSYHLPGKPSVKSDGTQQKLPVSSQQLKAKFTYSAYPRVSPLAYLGSRVVNDKNMQLLGGQVNIFQDGDYVGRSVVATTGPGEEFDLYLGADENVKIERREVEKKVDETFLAGIPSSNRKMVTKYLLKAENYKNFPIDLILFEAMPVSENDRIKARVLDTSVDPVKKDWDDRKGVWRWELKLDPGAKQEVVYSILIEYPKDMAVEGL